MTEDRPSPGAEGHWAEWSDAGTSTLELVEECVGDLEEPEDLVGAILTGEADRNRYVLAATRKVRDGNLLLTLRYVTVDLEEGEARTGSNRLRMRVQGSLLNAMPPLLAAIKDGAATPDDPQVLDARNPDGVDHSGNALTASLAESSRAETEESADQDEEPDRDESAHSRDAKESVDRHAGAETDTVVCIECESSVLKEDAVNIGGALGEDTWVHESACPEEDDDA